MRFLPGAAFPGIIATDAQTQKRREHAMAYEDTIRASAALMILRQGLSPLHPARRTGLGKATNKLRLQLDKRKESFRAKEKPGRQPENE